MTFKKDLGDLWSSIFILKSKKEGSEFWLVIGAQTEAKEGRVLVYTGGHLDKLRLKGEIKINGPRGYMIECPDYFTLGDRGIFIYSPQGIEAQGDLYNNIYQSGYIVGDRIDFDTLEFNHGEFSELDRGFDFYAPQTFLKEDRRIIIGWMGLPEIEYPANKNGWAHCLTLPRELNLVEGRLLQIPVKELEGLRKSVTSFEDLIAGGTKDLLIGGEVYELKVNFKNISATSFGLNLIVGNGEKTKLFFEGGKFYLDRSLSGDSFGREFGEIRGVS